MRVKERHIIAVLLLIVITVGMIILIKTNVNQYKDEIIPSLLQSLSDDVPDNFSPQLNKCIREISFPSYSVFNNMDTAFQLMMGRKRIKNTLQLNDGSFYYHDAPDVIVNDYTVLPDCVSSLTKLQAWAMERNKGFVYVQAPGKSDKFNYQLPYGIVDEDNKYVDTFLDLLKKNNINYIDYREAINDNHLEFKDMWYKTDAHWNPMGGFLAWKTIAKQFEEQYGFSCDPVYLDFENYSSELYTSRFLGGLGYASGCLFTGLENLYMYLPKFDTNFTFSIPSENIVRNGTFKETMFDFDLPYDNGLYVTNAYHLYTGTIYPEKIITNNLNPEGPKLLLIADSFGCALAPFMAPAFSQVKFIDIRFSDFNIYDYMEKYQPDYVVVLHWAKGIHVNAMID